MPASTEPRSETGNLNLLDERRCAHASIRGYLYQTCLGVLRWLDLKENEILLCEGDEDLDRFAEAFQSLLPDPSEGEKNEETHA